MYIKFISAHVLCYKRRESKGGIALEGDGKTMEIYADVTSFLTLPFV